MRLLTRNGNDWTERYPLVDEAVAALKLTSCILDGEITVCRPDGVTSFELLRSGRKIKPEEEEAPARGAPLASRRIRLSLKQPLAEVWRSVGHCGSPPKDHSRRFAIVAITLTLSVWIVLPLLVTLSLAG